MTSSINDQPDALDGDRMAVFATLMVGFLLALLSLGMLLFSQRLDAEGQSRSGVFISANLVMYAALFQIVASISQIFSISIHNKIDVIMSVVEKETLIFQQQVFSALFLLAAATWLFVTYIAPAKVILSVPLKTSSRVMASIFFLLLLFVIFWISTQIQMLKLITEGSEFEFWQIFLRHLWQPSFWR